MCFLLQVYNFLRIKRSWKRYLNKKELAKKGIDPTFKEEHGYFYSLRKHIVDYFKHQKKKHGLFILKITTSGTFESFICMSIVGLILGIIFSFIYFYFEIYLGDATVFWSLVVRLPIIVVLTAMVAFTQKGRCYLLLIPLQLFSTSGKIYMGGQVIFLMTGGPLLNLKHNINVIQDSSSCQQRGVSAAAAEVADMLFGPFSSFKQAAMEIVNGIKTMVEKLQNILSAFKRTVMSVANAIQDATKWINSKINGCKNSVGTTYQHCMEAFTWMHDECKVSVPSIFVSMCAVTEFASNLCSSVKPGEYLCDLVYFNVDPLVTTINQRINRLWNRAYTLMYFKVDIHHEYSLDSNSKSIAEELKNKITEVFDKAAVMSTALLLWGFLSILLKFYFLWRIYRYRSLYLSREEYDNYFITDKLKTIDMLESLKGEPSIFPLRRVEKKKYIKITSFFLAKKELKAYTFPAAVIVKTILVFLVIGLDHMLYFIVDKCRLFMLAVMQSFSSQTEVDILGTGFIAELSRRVLRTLNHMDYNFYFTHFMPCMPNPKPPNSWTNKKILFYLVMLWFSLIVQPYALRFRHIIMNYYYPEMINKRVKWLYNAISFRRMTFVSLVRIKLRAKYGSEVKDVSIADMLRAKFPWTIYIIGRGMMAKECMICNHIKPPLYQCPGSGCLGIYCDDCYINIKGICCLCKENMMHDDFKGTWSLKAEKDEVSDKEEIDEDEGLFLVLDNEEYNYLDYSYQGGMSQYKCSRESYIQTTGQQNNEKHGDVNNKVTTFYTFVDVKDFNRGGQNCFKYTRLKPGPSYEGKHLTYEDTFEMF